ncbi:GNAT family N-acetyltransferase [Pontivivens nitratireducens]|uniref:N-acetyltransferase n=1 Tax=Pontivivens nitratireducens TaxID=2758038 RepID=A0A6G7VKI0_9RHOB|nr:GNAT family N-acetyltransferase [Pontibrevibacter nitratireducens]QIK40358.1 N-acetyltransferase [Pontibrevibacter nitratireducens]
MHAAVRMAQNADIPAIETIWNRVIALTTATFTSEAKDLRHWLTAKATAGEPVLVLDTDTNCTGFATYGTFRGGTGYAHVAEHTVMLAEGAQRGGGGRALMHALYDQAIRHGKTAMIGGISGENTAAIRFHAALGFTEVGRIPGAGRKFGRDLELVLMHRKL